MTAGMRERDWQQTILEAAGYLGWLCYHTFYSRRSTPGFPDLCCVKVAGSGFGKLVFLEVKTERGRLTPEQRNWLEFLSAVPGVIARVERPDDWPEIQEILRHAASDAIPASQTHATHENGSLGITRRHRAVKGLE